jgi:DNA repair photolyase
MKVKFEEYKARKIVNVHKHADSLFWDKYSATPYVGCRSGCEFCYLRGGYYLGKRDPAVFDTLIKVKTNAVDLLKKELSRLNNDVISCGDWQAPAENRYRLSRSMLKEIHDFGFPLFIVERSPLIVRDIDLLVDINKKASVTVAFSFCNVDQKLKRVLEPHSPGLRNRFKAMERLAENGIFVGMALMPIIPFIGDDEAHLTDAIQATKDYGGSFVLGGGLSMAGFQAERTLKAFRRLDPELEDNVRKLYNWEEGSNPEYNPDGEYYYRLRVMVRDLCTKYEIMNRIPRFVSPGPLAINKYIAERLINKAEDFTLERGALSRMWAYRNAAWIVDDLKESISDIFREKGLEGLRALPGIGRRIAGQIAGWIT